MKILIVRNDKLGDFVLTLPCYSMLKQNHPDTEITVLVPEYTVEIARCCPYIDQVIIDDGKSSVTSLVKLVKTFRSHRFDAVITLFSTTRIALAVFLARISYRLAPATKIAQLFYNHRLRQRRSRSEKPEYIYNLDLIKTFLDDQGIDEYNETSPPYLYLDQETLTQLKNDFYEEHQIDKNRKLIFMHAGSGGSANNLSLEQYAMLATMLNLNKHYALVLTVGPGEEEKIADLSGLLHDTPHVIYHSVQGLTNFTRHIAIADLFISGSTGPLHIAGALDVPTAAFYTRRQSATKLRWQTLNSPGCRLAFSPPESAEPEDMSAVELDVAATEINGMLARLYPLSTRSNP